VPTKIPRVFQECLLQSAFVQASSATVQKYPTPIILPNLCPLKFPESSRSICNSLPSYRPLLRWYKSIPHLLFSLNFPSLPRVSAAVCLHISLSCDGTLMLSLEYATSFPSVIQSPVSSWRNSLYSTISSIRPPRDQSGARLSVTRLPAGWSAVQIPAAAAARLLSYFQNVQTSYIYPSSYTSDTGDSFPEG
jgi:hypothetical protein